MVNSVVRVAPCMPFLFLRSDDVTAAPAVAQHVKNSGSLAAVGPMAATLSRAVSAMCDVLLKVSTTSTNPQNGPGSKDTETLQVLLSSASEVVHVCLHKVLQKLDQVLSSLPCPNDSHVGNPSNEKIVNREDFEQDVKSQGYELIAALLANDVPALLLVCLDTLDFEAKKDAMRLFSLLLRAAVPTGAEIVLVTYLRTHPRISHHLLEGSGSLAVFHHCSQMLRACTRYPELVESFLAEGAVFRLLELTLHRNFDISSEAFFTLRELLLAHRAVSSKYLVANFGEFFLTFHRLLQPDMDYVSRRQALRLLGDVLLDRAFMEVMLRYVGDSQFLQIHMNLLRDSSRAIQLEAFHVCKIFVANPAKPYRVFTILYRNKDRLTKLLSTFTSRQESNTVFEEDLKLVIDVLKALERPAMRRHFPSASSSDLESPSQTITTEAFENLEECEVNLNAVAAA